MGPAPLLARAALRGLAFSGGAPPAARRVVDPRAESADRFSRGTEAFPHRKPRGGSDSRPARDVEKRAAVGTRLLERRRAGKGRRFFLERRRPRGGRAPCRRTVAPHRRRVDPRGPERPLGLRARGQHGGAGRERPPVDVRRRQRRVEMDRRSGRAHAPASRRRSVGASARKGLAATARSPRRRRDLRGLGRGTEGARLAGGRRAR